MGRKLKLLSDDSGLMFPKPQRKKKRKVHKKSILKTEKHVCYLCARLYNDYGYKYTEEHHVLYGAGQRQQAEEEGLKADLCIYHHREGPQAVHNNRAMRELLCRIAQREYEKTHSHEEWMEKFRKNYLEDCNGANVEHKAAVEVDVGDYVSYITNGGVAAGGFVVNIEEFYDCKTLWVGELPDTIEQMIEFVALEDVIKKAPPPQGVCI